MTEHWYQKAIIYCDYGDIDLAKLAVGGYGYRWIRLC